MCVSEAGGEVDVLRCVSEAGDEVEVLRSVSEAGSVRKQVQ